MSAPELPFQSLDPNEPKRTVLVVDDAPIFREIESVFLGRFANLITASDGTIAYEAALRERPDLVLTDLTMQQMHGDELCRRIRAHPDLRRMPVIVVTSGRSAEEHERAVRAGADDVVEKPLDRVSMLQVVHRLLRRTVRGLERVPLETEVRLSGEAGELWGWSRNVSRGGMFVELEAPPEPETELALEFQVPDTGLPAAPTARVVWRRPPREGMAPGMGLQFLKLDRDLSRWLESYVYERGNPDPRLGLAPAV